MKLGKFKEPYVYNFYQSKKEESNNVIEKFEKNSSVSASFILFMEANLLILGAAVNN
ncbi:MAG: hypothetical protein U5J96_17250 [Ignavibacteriaceae bacterium]|nr:hypothetical protein [Ignavibacteriaceae bacterium]